LVSWLSEVVDWQGGASVWVSLFFMNFLNISIMSTQAKNFIDLCRGEAISSIKQALRFVSPKVKNEIKQHYGFSDEDHMAYALQMGLK
jgi:hypothetical protein